MKNSGLTLILLRQRSARKWFPALMVLLFPGLAPCAANAVMQLIPPVQEIQVRRGYTGSFTVTIINTGDEDMPSRFSCHDLDISVDGVPFISDSNAVRGCGNWITIEPAESIIKAHESLELKGTITVPRDAEGSYHALIKGSFVGVTIPLTGERVDIKGSTVGLESQAMVAVLLTVPSSRNKPILIPDTLILLPEGDAQENGSGLSPAFGPSRNWKLIMPVRNDGSIFTRVSGQASIWSESGTRIGAAIFQAGKGYILPGKVRNLVATGDGIISDGYYMLRISLQHSDGAIMSNSFPFAVYQRKVYPGAITDEIAELISASSPSFSLRESFKQRTVTPGGVTYLGISLVNLVDDTVTLIPRKVEWNVDNIGQMHFSTDSAIQSRSCREWIEFDEDTVVLPPKRTKSFKMRVHAPGGIAGEYYSGVVFEPGRVRKELPPELMVGRTQLIALATPTEIIHELEVDSVRMHWETAAELTLYRFRFTVKNVGNAHCFVAGHLSLEREAAMGVYTTYGRAHDFGNRQTHLLPGGERSFEINIPNMEPGQYRIALAVTFEDNIQPILRYQTVTVP